ncbi:response regulator transcription factor [Chryseobacterium shandongense]|uniref:response regulator transcription factor n=1 Tax=Chryseobacterium shandongense TaxID=1493872 RepID=UPI000F4E8AE2|nr:response regulator transcription factor [Chryseobacterium shandongense]AZA56479.1 DNA-binding response regulator [Chryseobacterium shandongense]
METDTKLSKITLAFINDKSPILDVICNDFIASKFDVLFRSESIENGLSQLSTLNELPKVCIIDLDFYDKNVLAQLQKLRTQYPSIKLIAHSDIDAKKAVNSLLEIGFDGYMLIDSDTYNFKKAIEVVTNDRRYFSTGVADIVSEYFANN